MLKLNLQLFSYQGRQVYEIGEYKKGNRKNGILSGVAGKTGYAYATKKDDGSIKWNGYYNTATDASKQNQMVAQNIYNNIRNNGGSDAQAVDAVKNATGISNYWRSSNDYSTNASVRRTNTNNPYDYLFDYPTNYLNGIGGFKASDAYNQAMAYTNSLLEQLNSGRTAYSDKIDELMGKIEGRDKFTYDMDKDPMFQQYLESSMAKGKIAMQDTIGQASSLTGGYGSTYATAAANGAYNDYVSQAYDNVADYYNMALNAYNQEGQELYNQLGMYQTADSTAYSRLSDAYSANLANAQNMYNQEYNNYWDTANYNLNVQKYNNEQKQNAYNTYMDYIKSMNSGSTTTQSNSTSDNNSGTTKASYTLTTAQLTKAKDEALRAYNSGGDTGLASYMDSLPQGISDEVASEIVTYAENNSMVGPNVTYEKTKDTFNWFGGIDHNDVIRDSNGRTMTVDEYYEALIAQGVPEARAKALARGANNLKVK